MHARNQDRKSPFLNATGMTNMGDVRDFAQAPLHCPLRWVRDEESSKAAGIDLWFPFLSIPALADKAGASRPHKRFFPGEREMFVQAFANECAAYLFGVPALIEREHPDGIEFLPNPDFQTLTVHGAE